MIKRLLGVVITTFLLNYSFAQTNNNGFYETYIIVNNTYFDLGANTGNPNFEGNDLGTYSCSSGPILNGFESKLFKCGTCDVTSVMLFYRIYKEGTTRGAFSSLNQNNAFNISGAGSGCQNQQWQHTGGNISLYSALANGRYVFEVYSFGTGNNCFNGNFYDTNLNGNNNFKAYFTVSSPVTIGTVSSSSSVICYGSNTTLSVSTQSGGEKYYWQIKNPDNTWSNVDANTFTGSVPNYTVANLTSTATYRCRITNCSDLNEAISNEITLTPQRPTITTQPASQTDCSDLSMRFITGATGSGSLSFTWQKKRPTDAVFSDITTPTPTNTSTLSNILISNIGSSTDPNNTIYRCKVSDGNSCETISNEATLNVFTILSANDPSICTGQTALLNFTTQGTPVAFQWQKKSGSTWSDIADGGNISGATSSTLSISNISSSDNNTDYRCKVTFNISTPNNNCLGTTGANNLCTTSTCTYSGDLVAQQNRISTVTSPNPPTASANPICGTGTVTLTATSSLGTNEVYRWYADNTTTTVLQQNTPNQYTTSSLAVGGYTYYVSVYNTITFCESTRTPVTVTVNPLPTITLDAVTDICPQANSFNLPYSATTNSPNQYSITAGTPALSSFSAVTNATLGTSPLSVSIPANSTSGTYQFSISVRNSTTTCASTPQNFNLTIKNPTVVSTNPTSQTVCENDNLTLTAAGTGSGTVSYQWRKDGSNISGETSATYAITSIALTQAGNYDCLVIADCGTATTTAAVIIVNPKAKFTTQPTNQIVCREESATFSTSATGTGTLEFRWKKGSTILSDGTNILGSATNTLVLTNLQLADAGTYICEVKGACDIDFVPSNAVTLTVNDLPASPTVTSPINYCKDATASQLSATASGSNSLLWYGTNSTGGTSSTTAPTPLTNTTGTVIYYVSQKDVNGCESPRASISVITLPSVVASVSGFDKICLSGIINNSTTLTATATGGNGTYTYQWQNSAGNISSAINGTYDVTNAFQSSSSDNYKVVVTSGVCSATSTNAITVTKSGWLDISITGNTPDICGSGSKTLSIINPVGGATYKWFDNTTSTSELQTGTSYTTPVINSTTTYYAAREGAVATGLTCQSNRASATINVNSAPSAPTISSSDADNTVCAGESISLTANGCAGTINWSNGSNGSIITVSSSGTYSATCTVNGCVSSASAIQTITINPLPAITLGTISSVCYSASSFDLVYSNTINSPNKYSLTSTMPSFSTITDADLTTSPISIPIIANQNGTYTFTISVKNSTTGCVSASQNFNLTVLTSLSAGSIANSPSTTYCDGHNVANITSPSLASGGKEPLSYQWEVSTNGTDYSTVAGATTTTYDPTNISVTTYYRRKVTDACGEVKYSNVHQVNVVPDPASTLQVSNTSICSGSTVTLTASVTGGTGTCTLKWQWATSSTGAYTDESSQVVVGGNSYSYTTPALTNTNSSSITRFYRTNINCTGTGTTACNSPNSTPEGIVINPIPSAPVITSNDADNTICDGQSVNLTASGCGGVITWNTTATGSTLSISAAGTYSATCTQNGCTSVSSNIYSLSVSPKPTAPTITSSDADNIVCSGTNINLSASGCGSTINWSNGSTGSTLTVSSSGTFMATCTENSCVSDASALQTITVYPIPSPPTITSSDADNAVCIGQSINLTASGCGGIITWSNSSNLSVITVSASGTYNATCTENGCVSGNSVLQTITVNPIPSAPTITSSDLDNTICAGETVTLTASGCGGTVIWSNGTSQSTITINSAGTYNATCTVSGCVSPASSTQTIIINTSPTEPTIASSDVDNIICAGESISLTATGCAGTLAWSNGSNVSTITVNASGTYQATCTENGCTSPPSALQTIVVNSIPSVPTIASSDADNIICSGESVSLTANGCSGTVNWSNGSNGSTISVSSSGTYNATCTINGCLGGASALQTIVVNSLPSAPTITSSDADNVICSGESISLTANGCAGTITWSNGSNVTTITISSSGTYNATCTTNGCVSVASTIQNIVVNPLPTFATNPTDRVQCRAGTISFSGTTNSTATLQWEYRKLPTDAFTDVGTSVSGTSHTFSVTNVGSTTYPDDSEFRLKATTSNGCSATSTSGFLRVNSVSGDITDQTKCLGGNTSFDGSVLAVNGTVTGYGWESSTVSTTGFNPVSGSQYSGITSQTLTINPISATDALYYKIRVTFSNSSTAGSCSILSNSVKLTVTSITPPTVSGTNNICQGQTTTLTASGCSGVITWNTSSTGSTLSVFNAGTYSATCTQSGCTSLASNIFTLSVTPKPSAPTITSNDADNTVCSGTNVSLIANGCNGNVSWNNGSTGSTLIISTSGTFSAICTENSCVSDASTIQNITVNLIPSAPTISGSLSICDGQSTILTANGCSGTVIWSNGTTASSINVASAGTFSATCSVNNCTSSSSATQTVVLNTKPAKPIISGNSNICSGSSTTLIASGCNGLVTWNTASTGSTLSVSSAGTYTATCTENGCVSDNSDGFVIQVNPLPSIVLGTVSDVCYSATSFSLPYSSTTNSPTKYSITSTMAGFVSVVDADLGSSPINITIPANISGNQTFSITVKNATCSSNSQNFNVTILNSLSAGSIETSSSTTYCSGYNAGSISSVSLASGGKTAYSYQWEVSTNGTDYSEISGQTATTSDPPGLTTTTYYRRKVTDACGEVKYSNVHQISIVQDPTATAVATTPTTICSGGTVSFSATTAGGSGTCTIKWQSSNSASSSGTWTDEQVGGTTFTTSALNTVGKKYFRIFYDCNGTSCNQYLGTAIEVTINPLPTTPTVSGGGTICSGNSTTLTASGCNGTLSWTTGASSSTITVSTAGTYSAVCLNSCGTSGKSNEVVLNVTTIAPPTLSGGGIICSGQSLTLSASGCNGVVNWSNGSSGTSIAVSPSNTTTYTATCTESGCTSLSSSGVIVTVNQTLDFTVGTVSSLCNSVTAFQLPYSLTAGSADKYSMTSTMPDFVAVSNAILGTSPISVTIPSGKTGTFTFTLTLINSSSGCSKNQDVAVTVLSSLSAGSIETSSSTINCSGYNAGVISSVSLASGGKTTYSYQWEVSTNGTDYSEISGQTATTYDPPGLTTTTYYRRKVTDACGEVKYSNMHQISIVDDPQIIITDASDKNICSGNTITLTATTSGGSGTCTPTWQMADSPSGTWTNIQAGGLNYLVSLTNTSATPLIKYYRVIYSCSGSGSSSCNQGTSASVKVTVNYIPSAPTVTPASITICSTQSATLVASGCSGTIIWNTLQSGTSISVSSAGSYSAKCVVNSCESTDSNQSVVSVSSSTGVTPPVVSGSVTICQGSSTSLTATGCSGKLLWNNGNTNSIITVSPSITTSYTATCSDGVCISASSIEGVITVNPLPNITTQPQNQSDCRGNGVTFSVSANVTSGSIAYQWQRKKPTETAFSDILGATNASLSLTNVGNGDNLHQTEYRCVLSGTGGCSVTSNVATLTVNTVTGTLTSQSFCEGSSATINLSSLSIVGTPTFQWQKKNGSVWEDISDGNGISGTKTNSLDFSSLTASQTGDYRNKMVFTLIPSGTCTINSDDMTLSVTAIPATPSVVSPVTYCQNSVASPLLATPSSGNSLLWYNSATGGVGSSTVIVPSTSSVGTFSYYVSQKTSNNCESQRSEIQVIIKNGIEEPINTTPVSVTPPATLTFSAQTTVSGASLLWYNSATGGSGIATAPSYTASGTYSHWVTQTDPSTGCESPRLLITSVILNPFRITTQPTDQADCRGNSVNFTVSVAGSSPTFTYLWQRKLPTDADFVSLSADGNGITGFNTNNLRVSSVGNTNNPDLSQYRCIIGDGSQTLTSNSATLRVNSVSGSLANGSVCVGNNFSFNLNNFVVTGNVVSYQWQTRPSTSGAWTNLTDGNGISGTNTTEIRFTNVQFEQGVYYRCVVKFNTLGVVCEENTDPARLDVGGFPGSPSVSDVFYCQYASATRLRVNNQPSGFDDIWYTQATGGTGTETAPTPNTAVAGEFTYFVSLRNSIGCESPRTPLKVTIGQQPSLPTNATPSIVVEGTTLNFSALGENLRWYTTPTGTTFTTTAPSFSAVGSYTRYVSQVSQYSCVGPRLAISAAIIPSLKFTKQPTNQADCDGNSVTFSVSAAGYGPVFYQWQRKLSTETEFTDILNEKSGNLKIDDVGSVNSPNQTQYRCVVKDNDGTSVSSPATLTVNEVKGTFKKVNLCEGKTATINLKDLQITGKIVEYQWQKKSGSSYTDIGGATDSVLIVSEKGLYRCKIAFEVTPKTTCSRNTADVTVESLVSPTLPQVSDVAICQNNATFKLENQVKATNPILWYYSETDKTAENSTPKLDISKLGKTTLWVSQQSANGCESERKSFNVEVVSIPEKPKVISEFTYCRNEKTNALNATTDSQNQLMWYTSSTGGVGSTVAILPSSQADGVTYYYVSAKNKVGCESPRSEIKVSINPCIAEAQTIQSCLEFSRDSVSGNKWFDIFDVNGKLYASVNPNGQNLGKVSISVRFYQNVPKTSNGTYLMTRYLDFQSLLLKTFEKPVSIKIYYKNTEFEAYKSAINQSGLTINDFNIVHYDGIREDCGYENNDNFIEGDSYVIYKNIAANQLTNEFFSLQFEVNSFSENGATANDYTELTYDFLKVDDKSVKGSWKTNIEIRAEKFIIQRSADGKKWTNLKEVKANGTASNYEMIDYQPLGGKSFYRVVYVDKDGTKKYHDAKEIEFNDAICQVFPNPSVDKLNINLYTRNIVEKEIRLIDMLGKEVGFEALKNEFGINQIKPTTQLSAGTYFVVVIDENGKRCMQKIVINP